VHACPVVVPVSRNPIELVCVLTGAHERIGRIQNEVVPGVAEILRRMQSGDLDIKTKTNAMDLVTAADLESERRITRFIREQFPEDSILAEEGGGEIGSNGFTWVIDPVDGTINYAHGLPLYAISIGLVFNGALSAGLVHMPALGTSYTAFTGEGAFCDGRQIHVSATQSPDQAIVVTGFPYDRLALMEVLLERVRAILTNCRGIRRTGSASLDLCWLAEGRFDAQYELNLAPWDTCAAELIVREAGGRATDLNGNDHKLSDKSMLATNGHIHEDMLRILNLTK